MTIEIDEGRFRIVAGRRHMGSWPMPEVNVERTSIYRFSFDIEGDHLEFFPDDPSQFSDAVGAVIDLTDSKRGRFGLKARIQNASGS
ncbi:MAG TPA: hypothetical protein VI980_11370 [Acidimicrobiia bacterium]|nr:hypothetical protein [Acidimicrobiia bacterium]